MTALKFLFCCLHFFTVHKNIEPKIGFDNDQTFFVAHRGLTSLHLENTIKALVEALEAGADGVEFDVQLSSDLVPMVFHDRELNRLTGEAKNIDDLNLAELRKLSQTSNQYTINYPISTLDEVLLAMPAGKLINVELKETTAMKGKTGIDAVLKVLARHKSRLNMVISSFEPNILSMVHDATLEYPLGLLIDKEDTIEAYARAKYIAGKVDFLNIHIDLIDEKTSQWIKEHRIKLILWGHKKLGEESKFINDNHTALISDVVEDLIKEYRS